MNTLSSDELDIPTYAPNWLDGSFDADPSGEWMKAEDVRGVLAFIGGYLAAHAAMLEDNRVHPKIIDAVKHLKKTVEAL
jgi:hypothetical protein